MTITSTNVLVSSRFSFPFLISFSVLVFTVTVRLRLLYRFSSLSLFNLNALVQRLGGRHTGEFGTIVLFTYVHIACIEFNTNFTCMDFLDILVVGIFSFGIRKREGVTSHVEEQRPNPKMY
ncbi:uncharacterized protein AKAW2_51480A [Aspergillus luchuensis]|uniref:Uncharacterized protein n=1 Tax=Aspergillus kawachii TaxID=1069201 RepID=A0A7R7WEQ7_ASPKA|nr:uncharacterized protein AKAW2_51480A [Aspergillus luchuensis]BCS01139.1 hypothetical protein AKAW2_51480A [Aspergillus luchuensis]